MNNSYKKTLKKITVDSQQKSELIASLKEKSKFGDKTISSKKKFGIIFSAVSACAAVAIILMVTLLKPTAAPTNGFGYNNMFMNLSNVKTLAVVNENLVDNLMPNVSLNFVSDDTTKINNFNKLAYLTNDNKIEFATFNDGSKLVSPDIPIISFNQNNEFMLMAYSNNCNYVGDVADGFFLNNEESTSYIVNKQTGKIYYLKTGFYCSPYYGINGNSFDGGLITWINNSCYKIYIDNNDNLIVDEILDSTKLTGIINFKFCDKFGNSIICRSANGVSYFYVLNNLGELNLIAGNPTVSNGINWGNLFRSNDGVIYYNNMHLNKEGVFETNSNVIDEYILPSECLVLKNDNISYYIESAKSTFAKWKYGSYAVKVVESEDGTKTYSKISIENYNLKQMIINQNGIYTYNNSEISKLSFESEITETIYLNKDLVINSIGLYEFDKITFTALDGYSHDVHGLVDSLGNVSYEFTQPKYNIYIISPLN